MKKIRLSAAYRKYKDSWEYALKELDALKKRPALSTSYESPQGRQSNHKEF